MKGFKLNSKVQAILDGIKDKAQDRGITRKTWEDIINEVLSEVSESRWIEAIESHTPQAYLIKKTFEDPNLRDEILKFIAKKNKRNTKKEKEVEVVT